MSMADEIEKAIQAHRLWRAQLKDAIQTGKIEKPIDTIKANNLCAFGKWLYGPEIPANLKSSNFYKEIAQLHGEFHRIAGEIAQLAIEGKATEAESLMGTSGKYLEISAKLSTALTDWKKAVTLASVR